MQAIIDEFRFQDSPVLPGEEGSQVGDLGDGPASWAKRDPNRNIDPSGVLAAAVENLEKASMPIPGLRCMS